jgi:hypothetical protein
MSYLSPGANDGSRTRDLPITNRLLHEVEWIFRAAIGQFPVGGGIPLGSWSWIPGDERALRYRIGEGANTSEGDFPPATKTAHGLRGDLEKCWCFFDRENLHMGDISRDFVFIGNGHYVPFEGFGTISAEAA